MSVLIIVQLKINYFSIAYIITIINCSKTIAIVIVLAYQNHVIWLLQWIILQCMRYIELLPNPNLLISVFLGHKLVVMVIPFFLHGKLITPLISCKSKIIALKMVEQLYNIYFLVSVLCLLTQISCHGNIMFLFTW